MPNRVHLAIDERPLQQIPPASGQGGYEGIAFSSSGNVIGVAASEANAILLFRRKDDGRFEDSPYFVLDGSRSDLTYPHDLAFSKCGDAELLAVAQRARGISIYSTRRLDDGFGLELEISGKESGLDFSDGVAFVPPGNEYIAACNLELSSVCFYRRTSVKPIRYGLAPVFVLEHSSIYRPDGLAFSASGKWLAVANHGDRSVSIFRRNRWRPFASGSGYGPTPTTVIRDQHLRYPHSVAFTATSQLIVSNAGADHICVYGPQSTYFPLRWSAEAMLHKVVDDEAAFMEVNFKNEAEGGAKGIAIFGENLAVCGQQLGIKIYSFRETAYLWNEKRGDDATILVSTPELTPGTVIDFSKSGKGRAYFRRGWSLAEDWGTWSDGPRASLAFRLPSPAKEMKLRLLAFGFEPIAGQPQAAKVLVDDYLVSVIRLGPDPKLIELDVPHSVLKRGAGDHSLDFEIASPTRPADRGLSDDIRRLGIGIKSLMLVDERAGLA